MNTLGRITRSALFARSQRASVFPDEEVEMALNSLSLVPIVEALEGWRKNDFGVGGRPPVLNYRALLAAMLLLRTEHAPQLVTEMSNVFYRRLSANGREMLGLASIRPAKDPDKEPTQWYDRTWRCFHSLLDLMDPYPAPRETMNRDEWAYVVSQWVPEQQELKRARLDWFCNALLEMSFLELPERARDAWKGDVSMDQTKVAAVSKRGRPSWKRKNGQGIEIEPDAIIMERMADWYNSAPEFRHKDDARSREFEWAYALNLAVGVPHDAIGRKTGPVPHPVFAIGMKLSTPIRDAVAPDTVDMLASIVERGHPAGRCTGDKDYWAKQKPKRFALPIRALGYTPVTDYRKESKNASDASGLQGQIGGAPIADGGLFCPMTRDGLLRATPMYRRGEIDKDTYRARIDERKNWLLHRARKADETGAWEMRCPAIGKSATLECPLRELHREATDKERDEVVRPPAVHERDAVCTKSSIKIPFDESIRYLQDIPYKSRLWRATHGADRSDIERFNGVVKDGAKEALANPKLRQTRGFAAASVFAATALVSANRRYTLAWARKEARRKKRPDTKRRSKAFTPATLADYRPKRLMLTPAGEVRTPDREDLIAS